MNTDFHGIGKLIVIQFDLLQKEVTEMSLHVMALVLPIVQMTVQVHVEQNVRHVQGHVLAVQGDARLAARVDVSPHVLKHAPTHVLVIVPVVAQQVVLLRVKVHAPEAAQAAVAGAVKGVALAVVALAAAEVVLVVPQPAQIHAKHKRRKDVMDAVTLARQAVADNAIGLVVARAINSVKVLA